MERKAISVHYGVRRVSMVSVCQRFVLLLPTKIAGTLEELLESLDGAYDRVNRDTDQVNRDMLIVSYNPS
jgi:hypothetical protein